MSRSRGQDWLMLRMQSLGYKPNAEGVCFGVAHMAAIAILADDCDEFDERLRRISKIFVDNFVSTNK